MPDITQTKGSQRVDSGHTSSPVEDPAVGAPSATESTADPAAASHATDGYQQGQGEVERPGAVAGQGGLPEVLMQAPGIEVGHGVDPGDYYCEHMFFMAQREAGQPESCVVRNAEGEPLVGFLHIPSDRYQSSPEGGCVQAERHRATREVVGAALRGFIEAAMEAVEQGPIRVLLSGYGAFPGVVNNPTGDFVSHRENLDAAMQLAFSELLETPAGQARADTPPVCYVYRVRDAVTELPREVQLSVECYPVDDRAIDHTALSIQADMHQVQPHAVLSMGVAPGGTYKVEHRADSGGLSLAGSPRHDTAARPDTRLPDNYALARAVYQGRRAMVGSPGWLDVRFRPS